jgi:dipeptidyl aminopeptidase/acylaminoacyl peptidase
MASAGDVVAFCAMRVLPIALVVLGCTGAAPSPVPPRPAPPPVASTQKPVATCPEAPPATGETRGPVVLEGTPEVPADLRRRLQRYTGARSASLAALADDGGAMLVTTRFGDTEQAHLVRTPGGDRRQLTFGDEPLRVARFVPGTTAAITYLADAGGNEQYQVARMDLATGAVTLLTDGGKSRNPSYQWSADGSRVAIAGNARNGKDIDIYLSDGKSPGKLALERQGDWTPIDWSADGKLLLLREMVSINDMRLHVFDTTTGTVKRVTPETPVASYRTGVFDPGGARLYVASDAAGDFVELYEVDLATLAQKPLTRDIHWNVDDLAISPDGRTLAYVVDEGGLGKLHLLDTKSRREIAAPDLGRTIVSGLRFAAKVPVLGFTLFGPTQSGDAYTYDVRSKKLTRWTESETGGLDPARFVAPELYDYPTFDERRIPAFYYRPRGDGPHPVVVFIHGGPEAQARPYFNALLQYLVVESGVAVVEPNVRGSDGYGKAWLTLDDGKKREDSVKDIGALLDWIGTRKELDQGRVAVFGGSYGGYMVLASLVNFGARLRAGVDYVGISNFVTFLENTQAYRRDLRRVEYGDERDADMRAFLEKISPANRAAEIKSALFVAHGSNDPRVPAAEAEHIVQKVREQGRDVWYMLAKNEGHGFRKQPNRELLYQLVVMFLEKQLASR